MIPVLSGGHGEILTTPSRFKLSSFQNVNFGAKTHLCDGVMSALSLPMATLGLLAWTFFFSSFQICWEWD